MKTYLVALGLLTCLLPNNLRAQQLIYPTFKKSYFSVLNPAYDEANHLLQNRDISHSFEVTNRQQNFQNTNKFPWSPWSGMIKWDMHKSISDNHDIRMGAFGLKQDTDPLNSYIFGWGGSYHLKLRKGKDNTRLSFGTNIGANISRLDFSELQFLHEEERESLINKKNSIEPKLAIGIFLKHRLNNSRTRNSDNDHRSLSHDGDWVYMGVSFDQVPVRLRKSDVDNNFIIDSRIHNYFILGFIKQFRSPIFLETTILYKSIQDYQNNSLDLTGRLFFLCDKKIPIWIGVGIGTQNESWMGNIEFGVAKIKENINLGLSYEFINLTPVKDRLPILELNLGYTISKS